MSASDFSPGHRALPRIFANPKESQPAEITQLLFQSGSKTKFAFEEAVDVWLRHWSGQHEHHIAADYRINAGRVSEVLTEKKHVGSRQIAAARFNKSA